MHRVSLDDDLAIATERPLDLVALDVAKAAERPETPGLWRDFVLRLSSTPVVSIAKIRGRTRGIGNEFVLACDMRFEIGRAHV